MGVDDKGFFKSDWLFLAVNIFRLLVFSVIFISVLIVFAGLSLRFVDLRSQTVAITNIVFAVFISFASVLFSWARNEEGDLKTRVNNLGVFALLTSILFLVASGLKFVLQGEETKFLCKIRNHLMVFHLILVSGLFAQFIYFMWKILSLTTSQLIKRGDDL